MIILIRYGRLGHGLNSSERMPRLVLGPLAGVRADDCMRRRVHGVHRRGRPVMDLGKSVSFIASDGL